MEWIDYRETKYSDGIMKCWTIKYPHPNPLNLPEFKYKDIIENIFTLYS
jgi:hypothetical protein